MNSAFVIIATGTVYANYAKNLVESMREHFWFDPMVYIFTDHVQALQTTGKCLYVDAKGYPKETLYRYHTILSKAHIFEKHDQLFYIDADMQFVDRVELDDIASDGLTATLHPGYVGKRGTPEDRKESLACTENNTAYYCGGFQGGQTRAYLDAATIMAENIDLDAKAGVTAIWHDESHWNHYLANWDKPTKVLTPSFCYPEDYDGGYGWTSEQYPAKLMCLDKRKRGNHPRYK